MIRFIVSSISKFYNSLLKLFQTEKSLYVIRKIFFIFGEYNYGLYAIGIPLRWTQFLIIKFFGRKRIRLQKIELEGTFGRVFNGTYTKEDGSEEGVLVKTVMGEKL